MKRKIVWLALPLVLAALVFGVKWHAEHPTPTKLDLEVRALMAKATEVRVNYAPPQVLVKKEFAPFIDSFYSTPVEDQSKFSSASPSAGIPPGNVWMLEFWDRSVKSGKKEPAPLLTFMVTEDGSRSHGSILRYHTQPNENDQPSERESIVGFLHPLTIKRWLNLLNRRPHIDPNLR